MKAIHITLRQTESGDYRVESTRNTSQLTIGDTLTAKQVKKWDDLPLVTYSIAGMVPETETEEQPLLLAK